MSNVIAFQYQGCDIRFNEEGWINATDIAKTFGKQPNDWLMQRESVQYLAALSKALGKSDFLQEFSIIKELSGEKAASRAKLLRLAKKTGLVSAKAGVNGGTWLHPKLGVAFARWLDVDFAVWCDLHIDDLLRGNGTLRHQLDQTLQEMYEQKERGSVAGRELALHKKIMPPLERKARTLWDAMQGKLPFD